MNDKTVLPFKPKKGDAIAIAGKRFIVRRSRRIGADQRTNEKRWLATIAPHPWPEPGQHSGGY